MFQTTRFQATSHITKIFIVGLAPYFKVQPDPVATTKLALSIIITTLIKEPKAWMVPNPIRSVTNIHSCYLQKAFYLPVSERQVSNLISL